MYKIYCKECGVYLQGQKDVAAARGLLYGHLRRIHGYKVAAALITSQTAKVIEG